MLSLKLILSNEYCYLFVGGGTLCYRIPSGCLQTKRYSYSGLHCNYLKANIKFKAIKFATSTMNALHLYLTFKRENRFGPFGPFDDL